MGLLPSPVDPARYLISQSDNTLRLVNTATMKVEDLTWSRFTGMMISFLMPAHLPPLRLRGVCLV